MGKALHIPQKFTAVLVYGRPPLAFGGLLCAISVMWSQSPVIYTLGVLLLFISMSFDLVDGWFAARFRPHSSLSHLSERIMDKMVYSIIFPLVAVGEIWRLCHLSPGGYGQKELLHGIFVLVLCVTVLVRDNFASFMRGFALRKGQEPELKEYTRLRTVVAAPVGALLYAHSFYIPDGPSSQIYSLVAYLGQLPLRDLFFIEIFFLVINFGSIAGYCRKYGTYCLDELCFGDETLRRRILAFFPNALTLMNAVMGLLAVFFAYQYQVREAYLMLIGAALFDKVDGALARKLGLTESVSGSEVAPQVTVGSFLDDVSDAVSFCVAPAWIFAVILGQADTPGLRQLPVVYVAILYAVLGVIRLVYFTLDRHPVKGFFKGLPSPAAALFAIAPLVIFAESLEGNGGNIYFWGYLSFFILILSALLMNLYPLRYLHFGRLMSRHPWFGRFTILLALVFVFTPYFGYMAFFYLLLYVLSPLLSWRVEPEVAARES